MTTLFRLVLVILWGVCFRFGDWQYMLGASMAAMLILLNDISGKL